MITLEQYWMGRDVDYADELTPEIKRNASELLVCVNALLIHLEIEDAELSSGWRPKEINEAVGGAKNSRHMIGKAIDLKDPTRRIASKLTEELLEEVGLWAEDPQYSPKWVHLQTEAPRSGRRFFKP